MDEFYEYLLSSGKDTSEIYDALLSNYPQKKSAINSFFVVMQIKHNLSLTVQNNDLVIELIENEYTKTKNKELLQLIEDIKLYENKRKLEWKNYLEQKEFEEINPTPEESLEKYHNELELKKYKDIEERIGYQAYDVYKKVLNNVNQHDEYSKNIRIFELAKQSSQMISSLFLKEIKEVLPKQYIHFKSLADKISPD